MDNREKWVKAQVAYYHGVNQQTVQNWISRGLLDAEKVRGRWVCHPDDVRMFEKPRRGRSVVKPDKHEKIAQRRLEGESLQEIADDYDITRERIRQIVKEVDPTIPKQVKQARLEAKQARKERRLNKKLKEQMAYAIEHDLKCVVCGCWVLRRSTASHGNNFTCSPEHSEAWTILRTFDNHEEHRKEMARVYLASPDKYHESAIEWAHQMLSDNPPPPDRRYFIEGSKRAEIIKKYRPEQYKKIVDGEV